MPRRGIRTHNPSKWAAQTHALDRAATGIGVFDIKLLKLC
jgi:hypothetical protein